MSRATILIADDSSDIQTIMRYLLTELGFAVVEAADGHEAVRLARQCQPVLILLDLGDSCRTARWMPAGCHKPFDLHDISRPITALMLPHTMLAPHYA